MEFKKKNLNGNERGIITVEVPIYFKLMAIAAAKERGLAWDYYV